ncbi:hypothetical protein LZ32DRAFT_61187 [Colletotrichum eremochloae]|nr:hypothetical protein LZ32DRAFT_61187 [Colletotrichum eremochloae]
MRVAEERRNTTTRNRKRAWSSVSLVLSQHLANAANQGPSNCTKSLLLQLLPTYLPLCTTPHLLSLPPSYPFPFLNRRSSWLATTICTLHRRITNPFSLYSGAFSLPHPRAVQMIPHPTRAHPFTALGCPATELAPSSSPTSPN